jgi:hypothetical protein
VEDSVAKFYYKFSAKNQQKHQAAKEIFGPLTCILFSWYLQTGIKFKFTITYIFINKYVNLPNLKQFLGNSALFLRPILANSETM